MKNQTIIRLFGKKSLSICLSAVLAVSTLAGCGSATDSSVAETDTIESEVTDEEKLEQLIEDHAGIHSETESGNMVKEETVYVIANANGQTNDIIVSDWIKNPKEESGVSDVSSLTNIENTTGDEIYTEGADGDLLWAANGNDIHYQGNSDKELPVDIKVTYYLEGNEISPEEIAGKSGNVKIRFDYDNHAKTTINVNGKEEEVYVPFTMVSGMILDAGNFSNVEVSSGRIISEGSSNIVIGMAFPGLAESLQLDKIKEKENSLEDVDDIEIPDYVEVSAYAKNFEMDQTMSVAVTDIVSAIDSTSGKINTDNIKDSLGQLDDASTELSEGTVSLSDGAKELMDGARTLMEKSKELGDGAKQIDDGVGSLDLGAGDLQDGAKKLDDGVSTLMYGTISLNDGTTSLVEGVSTLKDGAGNIKAGTTQLRQGYEGENGAVSGAEKLADGMAQLNEAVSNAQMPSLSDDQKAEIAAAGGEAAASYAGSFAEGVTGGIASNVSGQKDGIVAMAEAAASASIQEQSDTIAKQAKSAAAQTIDDQLSDESSDLYQMVVAMAVGMAVSKTSDPSNYEQFIDTAKGYVKSVATSSAEKTAVTVASQVAPSAAKTTADQVVTQVSAEIADDDTKATIEESLSENLNKLGAGIALETAESIIKNVAETLGDTMSELGAATSQLADGSKKLSAGVQQLYLGTYQLDEGAGTLCTGVDSLQSGAYELNNGACSLKNGAIELKNGTGKLYDGTVTLKNGTLQLKNGTAQLYDGANQFADGTNQLYNGTKKLSDGSIELMNGMLKFDEEGIGKLTNLFGEDVDDAVERIKQVVNAGSDYKIYTEVPDGVESSVKIIYKTDAVKVVK